LKGIVYIGTVRGFKEFAHREILKAAFKGMTVARDAARIQRRLNRAAMQDKIRRILTQVQGGGVA